MTVVGIRALKQNASAVVRRAAAGDVVTITDRGRPVARLVPIRTSRLQELRDAGLVERSTIRPNDLPRPPAQVGEGPTLGEIIDDMRSDERYWPSMAWYMDTSALVKLVSAERETVAMHDWIDDTSPELVASNLLRTEIRRAARRAGSVSSLDLDEGLAAVDLLPATPALFETAGALEPVGLRSLDALHLATALDLGDDCEGMVTYDDRLAGAARLHGLAVIAPA